MVSSAVVTQPEIVYRHTLAVRITHWVNAFCLLVLLLSGLQIFNAHPTLYFGEKSEPDRAVLSMDAIQRDDGSYAGITTIGSTKFDTTGVLGLSRDSNGELEVARLPALDHPPLLPRSRHGAALAFLLRLAVRRSTASSISSTPLSGHIAATSPRRAGSYATSGRRSSSTSASSSPRATRRGATTCCRSSPISRVIFVLLPLMVLTGLTMSPAFNAAFPGCSTFRRPAVGAHHPLPRAPRGIVLFVVVHLVMVVVSGAWNNIRSMITGRYAIGVREGARMASAPLHRRGWLQAAGAALRRAALLGGCDQLSQRARVPRRPASAEALTERAQRPARRPQGAGARVHRGRHLAGTSSPTARSIPDDADYVALAAERVRRLAAGGRRPGGAAADALARRAARAALAHPDHPPRLRRGLERHRQVDGRAARRRC